MNQTLLFGTIHFQKLFTVSEVARLVEFLKKTGELLIPEHPTAKINFIDGKIVHARFEQVEGNDAVIKILQLNDCNVAFTIGPKIEQSNVSENLSALLEKAAQAANAPLAEQIATDKTVPVKITPEAPTESPSPTAATPPAVTPPQPVAPAQQAATHPQSAAVPPLAQPIASEAAQKTAPHPVPDTMKPLHGSPAQAPAAQQTPPVASSGPSTPSGTTPQQKQPASPPAGTAKKPILRITLKGVSKDFPITPGKLMTIGRTPDNDICIPDGQISTRHATLLLDAKGMHLVDQNSLNGVYFGGKKVTEIWLKPNDQFKLAEIPVIVTLA